MLDFTQFTTQDWIAVGSLAVSALMLVSNIVLAVVATARTNKYVPGELLSKFSLGPSRAMRSMIDVGGYDGEYEVASRPPDRVDPDVLEFWHAVTAKWSVGEVVDFEDIVDWVQSDAPDALFREHFYFLEVTGPDADMQAALLVNNDLFTPISGGLAA